MEYKEIKAKTVSDAITQACMELHVPSDELDYEVLSEGSKGFLGIGNKPAVIRYRKLVEETEEEETFVSRPSQKEVSKPAEKEVKEKASVNKAEEKSVSEEMPEEEKETEKKNTAPRKDNKDRHKRNRKNHRNDNQKKDKQSSKENVREGSKDRPKSEKVKEIIPVDRSEEEISIMKESAETFLKKVFGAMDLPAEIRSEYERETNCLNIEISGDDMGVLIGKRGQTLDSLQYLTSLCVNKNIKEYVRVKIDTEDYRRRRKETLENLAKNIASKVKKTGKAVVLEPMNPYERRIIHSALQPNNYVETYSEGNEPYRHVVVTPKK